MTLFLTISALIYKYTVYRRKTVHCIKTFYLNSSQLKTHKKKLYFVLFCFIFYFEKIKTNRSYPDFNWLKVCFIALMNLDIKINITSLN